MSAVEATVLPRSGGRDPIGLTGASPPAVLPGEFQPKGDSP